MVTTSGACTRCRSTRRWRLLHPGGEVACWVCWRCSPPPPGSRVDILNLVQGEPRTLLARPAESLNEQLFTHDIAEHGAPMALELRSLPCRCRVCSPRAGQRDAA